jgi:hypothetical protein
MLLFSQKRFGGIARLMAIWVYLETEDIEKKRMPEFG